MTVQLYEKMKTEDFSAIIRTALLRSPKLDRQRAEELMDAFLQWVSCVPTLEEGQTHQMLRSVDLLWEAFLLNSREYRAFCQKHVGFYVDHDALDVQEPEIDKVVYARDTLKRIRSAFGDSVNPELTALEQGVTCCYFKKRQGRDCIRLGSQ